MTEWKICWNELETDIDVRVGLWCLCVCVLFHYGWSVVLYHVYVSLIEWFLREKWMTLTSEKTNPGCGTHALTHARAHAHTQDENTSSTMNPNAIQWIDFELNRIVNSLPYRSILMLQSDENISSTRWISQSVLYSCFKGVLMMLWLTTL